MPLPAFQRAQSFIIVWPGDEEVSVQYNGEPVIIPATSQVADPGAKHSRHRFPSAKDRAGNPIPGTVLLSDIVREDAATAGIVKPFDAREWCEGVYANNKPLINRGLRIVVEPEEVEAARAEGRPLWEKGEIGHAESVLREELARMDYWSKKGQPAPESSSHEAVMKAKAFLENVHRNRKDSISKDDLLAALGEAPKYAPAVPAAAPVAPPAATTEDPQADLAIAARAMRKAAQEGKVNLTKAELEGLIDLNVEVMTAVEKKLEEAGAAVA